MYEAKPIVSGKADFSFVCPPDKSMTHRAIIFASLAKGKSEIWQPLLGEDCLATLDIFKSLGVSSDIKKMDGTSVIYIDSPGQDGLSSPNDPLDCGNSGTTARLLIGLFSSIQGLEVNFIGDESLTSRPMGRIVEPMRSAGADIEYLAKDGYFPLKIKGKKLSSCGPFLINKASAQIKSGVLLGHLNGDFPIMIDLPAGARTHTEVILRQFGANISVVQKSGREIITFSPPFKPEANKFRISGDPSSAAFFMAYAGIWPGSRVVIKDVLKNKTRNGFIEAVKQMGLQVLEIPSEAGFMEETASLECIAPQTLKPVLVDKVEIPTLIDELPILAVMALYADGESHFQGIEELRFKESDRLAAIVRLIEAVGGSCRVEQDDLYIQGNHGKFPGFTFDPKFDHRLFMAAAILATKGESSSQIQDPECVNVSFPSFFDLLDSLR